MKVSSHYAGQIVIQAVTYTRCRIDTVNSPDDGQMVAQNTRIKINIQEKLCSKLGSIYKNILGCTVSKIQKTCIFIMTPSWTHQKFNLIYKKVFLEILGMIKYNKILTYLFKVFQYRNFSYNNVQYYKLNGNKQHTRQKIP
jgi:hypothetical protein